MVAVVVRTSNNSDSGRGSREWICRMLRKRTRSTLDARSTMQGHRVTSFQNRRSEISSWDRGYYYVCTGVRRICTGLTGYAMNTSTREASVTRARGAPACLSSS